MKRNVGILIPSLNGGGAERAAIRISQLLATEFNVHLVVLTDEYNSYDFKGNVIFIDNKSIENKYLKNILRIIKLREIKKNLKLDVMISFLEIPNVLNVLSNFSGCKKVVSIRSYNFFHTNPIKNSLLKFIYRKADHIIAVSKLITEEFTRVYKIKSDNISTIYNPISRKELLMLSTKEITKENEMMLKNEFTFIAIGRMSYPKGHWHLIKSFSKLIEKGYPVKLVILGEDFTSGKAEKLIKELKIENHIELLGFVANPFPYLKKSDVFILTSLYEGFPNGLVEAMALGLPTISTDCKSGPKEIYSDLMNINEPVEKIEITSNGILVPQLEVEENWDSKFITPREMMLSTAMEKIYLDDTLRQKLSLSSIKRVDKFDNESIVKKYIKIINQI